MSLCPCGSQKELEICCKPIIDGTENAKTAESLMRARYTAHATQSYPFLNESTHPEFRDDVDIQEIEKWSSALSWDSLEIHEAQAGGEEDTEGAVSFSAHYSINGMQQDLTEDAIFRKEGDKWYYVEGTIHGNEPYRRENPKIGRNDPCSCGSGKKYKKCCMNKA